MGFPVRAVKVVLYLGQTLECASAPHATWAILAPVQQTGAARAPFLAVERSHDGQGTIDHNLFLLALCTEAVVNERGLNTKSYAKNSSTLYC